MRNIERTVCPFRVHLHSIVHGPQIRIVTPLKKLNLQYEGQKDTSEYGWKWEDTWTFNSCGLLSG